MTDTPGFTSPLRIPDLGHRADEGHAFVLVDRRQRRVNAGPGRLRLQHPVDQALQLDRLTVWLPASAQWGQLVLILNEICSRLP